MQYGYLLVNRVRNPIIKNGRFRQELKILVVNDELVLGIVLVKGWRDNETKLYPKQKGFRRFSNA